MIEEIIGTGEHREKVQGHDSASPVCVRVADDLSRVLATHPVITSDKPPSTKYPKGFKECKWKPTGMNGVTKNSVSSSTLWLPFIIYQGDGKDMDFQQ